MTLSDDILMAYADGELNLKMRAQVEDAMAADPRVAGRVAAHKALRNKVRTEFNQVLEETVPDRLVAAARATSRAPLGDGVSRAPLRDGVSGAPLRDGVVVPLRVRRARTVALPRWAWPQWGAVAASFVLGALVLHFGTDWYSSGPVAERGGLLVAAGALDKALSNQLVGEQAADSAVRIGVSFRSKGGSYCRTFQLRETANLAGLACREGDQWRLDVLARGEPSQDGGTGNDAHSGYRPAGSALPSSIVQAVDQAIDGEPLDAAAEGHAKMNQWRVPLSSRAPE
jgi:anti-sigma factor RsiW